jgi:glycosyltransferase involved in cell wall biosynthesis
LSFLKITHVIGSCGAGGAEIFTKSLLKELKNNGTNVELWVMSSIQKIAPSDSKKLNFEKAFVEELRDSGVSVAFVGKRPKKDWARTKRKLRQLYADSKSQLIHSHLESVSFHVCRAFGSYGMPLVQTVHSTKIGHPLVGRTYLKKNFAKYVAISQKVAEIIEAELGEMQGKLRIIPNGVELKRLQKDQTTQPREDVKTLIAIGRLAAAKDYFNLLQAFRLLGKKLIARGKLIPQLWIVGEGELRQEIEREIREYELGEFVRLLGLRNDIPDLLEKADIYVMASEWEGLSIALIEALAAGLPIVATDAGSNDEVVVSEESGLIVPKKDPVALAKGILRLMEDYDLRSRFSQNARERAKEFSIERCAEKHIAMYEDVILNSTS